MHIKYLFALMLAFGTPVLADQTKATIEDIYVDRIYVEPAVEKTCREVDVPIMAVFMFKNHPNRAGAYLS